MENNLNFHPVTTQGYCMTSEDYHNIAHQTTLMDFLFFLELETLLFKS